jgi:hypothetical protein
LAITHLGVPASDLVLLESIVVGPSNDPRESIAFFRVLGADGNHDPTVGQGAFGYTPPPMKALIITELDWEYGGGVPHASVTLRVFLTWPAPAGDNNNARVLQSTILIDSKGSGGANISQTTGAVVTTGVKITVDVIGPGQTGKLGFVLLRGYLTDFPAI